MKTLQKLFAAVLIIAVAAFVGCADSKTPDKTDKTPVTDHGDHGQSPSHDQDAKSPEQKTPMQTEPMENEGPEILPPGDNPDVKPDDEAESGSSEKKGGVEIPEE